MKKLIAKKHFSLVANNDRLLFGVMVSKDIRGLNPYVYKYVDIFVGPLQFVFSYGKQYGTILQGGR
jgi:hypothetical protein